MTAEFTFQAMSPSCAGDIRDNDALVNAALTVFQAMSPSCAGDIREKGKDMEWYNKVSSHVAELRWRHRSPGGSRLRVEPFQAMSPSCAGEIGRASCRERV